MLLFLGLKAVQKGACPALLDNERRLGMPRPQFGLKAMFLFMAFAGTFFGGMVVQKRLDQPTIKRSDDPPLGLSAGGTYVEILELPDGTEWSRWVAPTSQDY